MAEFVSMEEDVNILSFGKGAVVVSGLDALRYSRRASQLLCTASVASVSLRNVALFSGPSIDAY